MSDMRSHSELVLSLGTFALEEGLISLIFDRSGRLPDLRRAEKCAQSIVEMGGLLMATLMCVKGQATLADSHGQIKKIWSDKMLHELGDRMLELAGHSVQ
jgi:hypothetical protein